MPIESAINISLADADDSVKKIASVRWNTVSGQCHR